MNINLDMLCTTMLDRVTSHVDSAGIISKNNCRGMDRTVKLMKKLTEPTSFGHNMSYSKILGLNTGARNHGLAFGGPGHKVVAETDTIA